ncbi:MAG: hypothetical protein FWC21_05450, partial [Treponema sp.]|nr:hypothetical protein [Treponema sp.]
MLRNARRFGIVLFALILAAGLVFAGCTRNEGGGTSGINLRGANISVASWWSSYNVDTYEPRNEGEEKTLEYRKKILRDEGFSFQFVEISDWDNYLALVASNIMSGNRNYQIYELGSN